MILEFYKITFGTRKKIYESKKAFEHNWSRHCSRYSSCYEIVAYKLEDNDWKEIRRVKKGK